MIEIIGYLFASWGLGWCFGFAIKIYNKFIETTYTG